MTKPATVTELREKAEAAADATADVELPKVEHPSLAEALVAALASLTVVEKGRTADMGTYKVSYADLADVVKRTRPVLARHGIVALTPLCNHGPDPACSVVLVHEGGESMTFGPFPFQHGRDAQATGSWVTYMRRYALVAALGMAAGDDDDGAAAKPRPTAAEIAAAEKAEQDAAKDTAKAIVLELAEGDRDLAKQAWTAIAAGSWDRDALTERFTAWVNQPKDEPPAEPKDSAS